MLTLFSGMKVLTFLRKLTYIDLAVFTLPAGLTDTLSRTLNACITASLLPTAAGWKRGQTWLDPPDHFKSSQQTKEVRGFLKQQQVFIFSKKMLTVGALWHLDRKKTFLVQLSNQKMNNCARKKINRFISSLQQQSTLSSPQLWPASFPVMIHIEEIIKRKTLKPEQKMISICFLLRENSRAAGSTSSCDRLQEHWWGWE